MQNSCEDRELSVLLAEIEELNLQVELLVAQHQQKGSPTSVARSFSPTLSPPKPTESPETTQTSRKSMHKSATAGNPRAQTQVIRKGFFTPPSSPQKNKKATASEFSSPYSKIGPN